VATHALNGLGYIHLLKARATHDKTTKRSFLVKSKVTFNEAEKFFPSIISTYNLVCVCSLLEQELEAENWLQTCIEEGHIPSILHIQKDADLDNLRDRASFLALLPGYPKPQLPAQTKPIEDPIPPKTEIPPHEPSSAYNPIKYSDDPDLNAAITYDAELNKLQSSLLREGFSMSAVIGMVTEVGKAKKKLELDNAKLEENRTRLNSRLKIIKLKEKRFIPGDGNCQFASISDQLYDNLDHAANIRDNAVNWLLQNRDWKLPNGAVISEFAHDQSWDEFCGELSRSGIWGNHLTLVAVSEYIGAGITVISSVEGGSFIINIEPTAHKIPRRILLSHYAEYHYGSLTKE